MYSIYPIVCSGYCLIEPKFIDMDDIPFTPWAESDNCEGWESTTHRKFSMDGKRVVWLCPECAKRWKDERQEIINDILNTMSNLDNIVHELALEIELLSLKPTKDEIYLFNSMLSKRLQ